jgi:uncharacterized Zn finger protein (UPF0148 family)
MANDWGEAMRRQHTDPGVSREELDEIKAGILRLAETCPVCRHPWFRHAGDSCTRGTTYETDMIPEPSCADCAAIQSLLVNIATPADR